MRELADVTENVLLLTGTDGPRQRATGAFRGVPQGVVPNGRPG